jgi:hypothetical protein
LFFSTSKRTQLSTTSSSSSAPQFSPLPTLSPRVLTAFSPLLFPALGRSPKKNRHRWAQSNTSSYETRRSSKVPTKSASWSGKGSLVFVFLSRFLSHGMLAFLSCCFSSKISRRSYGNVYRAVHIPTHRNVAAKFLKLKKDDLGSSTLSFSFSSSASTSNWQK